MNISPTLPQNNQPPTRSAIARLILRGAQYHNHAFSMPSRDFAKAIAEADFDELAELGFLALGNIDREHFLAACLKLGIQ